jgi:ABC-type Zn uptake system ZnuABC Zn-binding protein ZnuA
VSSQNVGGTTRDRDGILESEDDLNEVRLPSSIMLRTFQIGLWDRINKECGTYIDEYEGVWLDPVNLVKAANVIRQSLSEEHSRFSRYETILGNAAEMLEKCASRGVRVMFSL